MTGEYEGVEAPGLLRMLAKRDFRTGGKAANARHRRASADIGKRRSDALDVLAGKMSRTRGAYACALLQRFQKRDQLTKFGGGHHFLKLFGHDRSFCWRSGFDIFEWNKDDFARVVPPPIELVDWDHVVENKLNGIGSKAKDSDENGDGEPPLFD